MGGKQAGGEGKPPGGERKQAGEGGKQAGGEKNPAKRGRKSAGREGKTVSGIRQHTGRFVRRRYKKGRGPDVPGFSGADGGGREPDGD